MNGDDAMSRVDDAMTTGTTPEPPPAPDPIEDAFALGLGPREEL